MKLTSEDLFKLARRVLPIACRHCHSGRHRIDPEVGDTVSVICLECGHCDFFSAVVLGLAPMPEGWGAGVGSQVELAVSGATERVVVGSVDGIVWGVVG